MCHCVTMPPAPSQGFDSQGCCSWWRVAGVTCSTRLMALIVPSPCWTHWQMSDHLLLWWGCTLIYPYFTAEETALGVESPAQGHTAPKCKANLSNFKSPYWRESGQLGYLSCPQRQVEIPRINWQTPPSPVHIVQVWAELCRSLWHQVRLYKILVKLVPTRLPS